MSLKGNCKITKKSGFIDFRARVALPDDVYDMAVMQNVWYENCIVKLNFLSANKIYENFMRPHRSVFKATKIAELPTVFVLSMRIISEFYKYSQLMHISCTNQAGNWIKSIKKSSAYPYF